MLGALAILAIAGIAVLSMAAKVRASQRRMAGAVQALRTFGAGPRRSGDIVEGSVENVIYKLTMT